MHPANVESVENKQVLSYSAVSFLNITCTNTDKVSISNVPIRKVQSIACEILGKVAALTIDSGCEGDCIKLETCHRLGIKISPIDKNDNKVPTQADGKSPLEIARLGLQQ